MATFETFNDLPVEIKQRIREIQGKDSAIRTTDDVAVLAAYDDQINNEVIERNTDNEITVAQGKTIPDGLTGFAKGATFIKKNGTDSQTARYENVGDADSASFKQLNSFSVEGEDSEGSYQVIAADLELAEDSGGVDNDPAFKAPIMGNILGDALTATGNYLAGLIGAFSITGEKATKYPSGAVMGVVMDGADDLDAVVLAVIDGSDPSATTKARAAFGVRQVNNDADSGVDYGLDLHDAGDTDIMTNAEPFKVHKALLRSPNEVCVIEGDGAPVDYTDGDPAGTGEGFAAKGSLYIDYTNADIYINTGTKAEPAWTELTQAS